MAYRVLFRSELDADAVGDSRMALNQDPPLGESRFVDSIELATRQRRGSGRDGVRGSLWWNRPRHLGIHRR